MKLADLPPDVQTQLQAIRAARAMADPVGWSSRVRGFFRLTCCRCEHSMRVLVELHDADSAWWRRVCKLCVKKADAARLRRSLEQVEREIETMEHKRALKDARPRRNI